MPRRCGFRRLFLLWFGASVFIPIAVCVVSLTFAGIAAAQTAAAPSQSKFESASSTTDRTAPVTAEPSVSAAPSLRLGVGDIIQVAVFDVPELKTDVRISNDGTVYLPLINYVHVAGLSIAEAQTLVEKLYSDGGFVKNPHVEVFVSEYASQGVSVLGEVGRPGVYPAFGQQHLFDLFSVAGGLTEKAGKEVTITRRGDSAHPLTVPISRNLADNPASNVEIQPGDTIVVRRADMVYVVGDVQRPTGIVVDRDNFTVMQAIALAGGTTKTSKMNGAKIIHKDPTGTTETPVQLKKILEAKVPDVPLRPDDILFIPTSSVKQTVLSNASLAMQATYLAVVVAR